MIDLTDEQKKIIRSTSVNKELTITFLDSDIPPIKNNRIYFESLGLVESLCDSENLIFGSCECSQMKIQVADLNDDVKNLEISLDLTVGEVSIPLGIFYIYDIEKATDKRYKKLVCYDRMYYMNTDVITWYNQFYPTVDTTHTLKEFRDSFFSWMGIEQEEITLVNDNMVVLKTIDTTELSGLKVIQAICEINGCFGHITREGKFRYVFLENRALYPSEILYPNDELYPGGGESEPISHYMPSSEQGDYQVRAINKLQIRQESGDIGTVVTSSSYTDDEANSYIINGNFLIYGKNANELDTIAKNVSAKIFGITYIPHNTNVEALPYMEVGDSFYLKSNKYPFISFILKRTISGIQSMKDSWEAKGEEFQPEISNENNQEIIQLRARVNILTRTVDETKSEITRVETTLKNDYPTTEQMNSAISQTAESITSTVSKTYETQSDAGAQYSSLSTRITQNATSISSKVSKNSVISEINQTSETIKINASKINLTGYVTVNDLSGNGTTTINGANITTGTIKAERIGAGSFTMTGGSINIDTGTEGGYANRIFLRTTDGQMTLAPFIMKIEKGSEFCSVSYGFISSTNSEGKTQIAGGVINCGQYILMPCKGYGTKNISKVISELMFNAQVHWGIDWSGF